MPYILYRERGLLGCQLLPIMRVGAVNNWPLSKYRWGRSCKKSQNCKTIASRSAVGLYLAFTISRRVPPPEFCSNFAMYEPRESRAGNAMYSMAPPPHLWGYPGIRCCLMAIDLMPVPVFLWLMIMTKCIGREYVRLPEHLLGQVADGGLKMPTPMYVQIGSTTLLSS